jgi:hypothetical protein
VDSTELELKVQVRGDHPFPVNQQIAYFEITIYNEGVNSMIGAGFCHEDSSCVGMPGWVEGAWAYHGDDGKLFLERGQGVRYGDTYGTGDVVGCGVDSEKNELFFTKNGEYLGKFKYLRYLYYLIVDTNFVITGSAGSAPKGRLFAVVGIGCQGAHLSINFGPSGFRYKL